MKKFPKRRGGGGGGGAANDLKEGGGEEPLRIKSFCFIYWVKWVEGG